LGKTANLVISKSGRSVKIERSGNCSGCVEFLPKYTEEVVKSLCNVADLCRTASTISQADIQKLFATEDQRQFIADTVANDDEFLMLIALKARQKSLKALSQMISRPANQLENEFQAFFQKSDNQWILGNAIDFVFVHNINMKQQSLDNGSNFTDGRIENSLGYSCVVEIKTPQTPLLTTKEDRNNIFPPSSELVTAVCQVLHYTNRCVQESDSTNGDGTRKPQYLHNSRGLIVVGDSKTLDSENKKRSFEIFRNSLSSINVLTYDELRQKANKRINSVSTKVTNGTDETSKPRPKAKQVSSY
jgi:hypothetical protein